MRRKGATRTHVAVRSKMRADRDMPDVDDIFLYLKMIDAAHGKIYCLNFLTSCQMLSLPDAILFYDCFVRH